MRIGHPDLWWVALAPLFVVACLLYGGWARRRIVERAGKAPLIQRLMASLSPERRLIKQCLLVLAVALLAFAALRPQFGRRPEPLRRTGIDVAVAFDISKSMLARDVQPSRLDAARDQVNLLMQLLSGDRVALVPFAGVAFTQSPLTADAGAIRLYLKSLDPAQMPVGGTNLAMAIQEGVKLLTGGGDKAEKGGRSRVLLLVTDGEDVAADQGEAARAAARKAAEAGVKVFALAVGTRLGEPIPLYDSEGRHQGYQKGTDGKPIYSKLNIALLEELTRLSDPAAAEAKRVFHFDGASSMAEQVVAELDLLQKATLETSIKQRYGEKFQYALLPALLLLLAEMLVRERRRRVPR